MGEAQEFFRSLQGSMGKYHKDLKSFVGKEKKSKHKSPQHRAIHRLMNEETRAKGHFSKHK